MTTGASGMETETEWRLSAGPVAYPEAVAWMEARAEAIRTGKAGPCIWLLEHPPLYTAGTSAKSGDLLGAKNIPVFASGRGGQYTYHGPGQRVAYVLLDLKALFAPAEPDLRAYIKRLEAWIIAALAEFGVEGAVREGRVGIWVCEKTGGLLATPALSAASCEIQQNFAEANKEKKIAAIGVRVRRWVAYHGIAINVHPDLSHYRGIVPCGIREYGVTSLEALGIKASLADVDAALKRNIRKLLA